MTTNTMITNETKENPFGLPSDMLACIFLFLHQIEINDYTSKDGMHELKMNAYYPAIHFLYTCMVDEGLTPDNKQVNLEAQFKNACVSYRPTDPKLIEQKKWIETASYKQLLAKYRFAPIGDPFFCESTGDHFQKIMRIRRQMVGDEGHVAASKALGWD